MNKVLDKVTSEDEDGEFFTDFNDQSSGDNDMNLSEVEDPRID